MTTDSPPPQEDSRHKLGEYVVPSYAPEHPNKLERVIKWGKIIVFSVFGLAAVIGLWGHSRWMHDADARVKALEAASPTARPERYFDTELEGLPPVVARYFSKVLNMNQPMVRRLYMEQTGTFNRSTQAPEKWIPFTAWQRVTTKRPGFVWDAAMTMPPGITVRVVDAYVGGVGSLQPSVFGLFDVGGVQGGEDIARGELIRYFAESVWYPTALLPSQGVQWKTVDAQTAKATMTDGPLTVTLTFSFNAEDGTIARIGSDERSALIDGNMVLMPWEVRLSDYQQVSGMVVPYAAEVAWLTPNGRLPYWRGKVEKLDYEMPR